jgi:eukaryotic-like serine/threonine-protein kinase
MSMNAVPVVGGAAAVEPAATPRPLSVVGRYVLHAALARGGMATIHLARLLGAQGFSRVVAAKRLHPCFTEDPEFRRMFLDEARIASRVHHPNVVPVLDVVEAEGEVVLVQEYVHGVPLDKLLRATSAAGEVLPVGVAVAVAADVLAGLSAAHEARDELGAPLGIVHRDVSPQNVIVGVDGIARLLDFGVAKATLSANVTRAGVFKGKLAYCAAEQLQGRASRASDLYAASVVVWEALAGRRLHAGRTEAEIVAAVAAGDLPRLMEVVDPAATLPSRRRMLERLDPIVRTGMELAEADRWPTAGAMREAVLAVVPAAGPAEVSRWVKLHGQEYLEGRQKLIVDEESTWRQRASAVPEATAVPQPPSSRSGAADGSLRASVVPVAAASHRFQWAMIAALALIGAVLTGILVLLLQRPSEAPAVTAAPAAPSAPPVPAPAPAPSPVQIATPAPTTSADAAPPVAQPASPLRMRPVAPRAAPTAAPSIDCNPPFYFDGKKKVFKPGCL